MLRSCAEPGCASLTLGRYCVEHETLPVRRTWPRGRAFRPAPERVLVVGADPETRAFARAAAVGAWPGAEVVTSAADDDPVELALAHEPDVILVASTAADVEDVAAALVLDHGLPDAHVILFTEVRASMRDSLIVDDGIPLWIPGQHASSQSR
jgi:hypothetical protein